MKLIYDDCFMCDSEISKSQSKLLNSLREISFAVVELNLFLDTHPHNMEALKLFKKLCANKEILEKEYVMKYGPLCACDSAENTPFEWVSEENKWPWQRGGEK